MRSSPPDGPEPPGPIGAYQIRGGDGTLDGGGLTVATSTDITCEGDGDGDGDQDTSGPLAGKPVTLHDLDGDGIPDRATINAAGCTVREGATITGEDTNGEQGTVTDGDGVEITATQDQIVVRRTADAERFRGFEDMQPPITVVSSTGITCQGGGDGDGDGNGDGDGTGDGDTIEEEPQDKVRGPLAGGTAIGDDVLVVGDLGCGPTGQNPCIDQITIETEGCVLTGQGDDLTITVSHNGEPFRIRDGDNVDITLQKDGTIVANGRKTLGDTFPPDQRDNPTRRIVPIPVQGSSPGGSVNDTFPIVSSTGIGGEGCHAVGSAETGPDDGNGSGEVIEESIPDRTLPDTGGFPLWTVAIIAIVAGMGLAALRMKLPRG